MWLTLKLMAVLWWECVRHPASVSLITVGDDGRIRVERY
jgi:hypothetical protein